MKTSADYTLTASGHAVWVEQVGPDGMEGLHVANFSCEGPQTIVIDFLDFRVWPVFNVADIAICVGVALIVLSLFRREEAQQGREKNHDRK